MAGFTERTKNMKKIAIYGKGGIGKSTMTGNLSAAFSVLGQKVVQIGCDPKADSTINLLGGEPLTPVMDYYRDHDEEPDFDHIGRRGYGNVFCIETGGPTPGLGCAGRGIIAALEKLAEKGAYDVYKPDVVIYDVLGDVVCGGFSMPMRSGYADKVFVITSGENMAIHAAANIAMAVEGFKGRGYAQLGGIILNRRNVKNEDAKVAELAEDIHSTVITTLSRSDTVQEAEDLGKTVVEAFPESAMAAEYRALAKTILEICEVKPC